MRVFLFAAMLLSATAWEDSLVERYGPREPSPTWSARVAQADLALTTACGYDRLAASRALSSAIVADGARTCALAKKRGDRLGFTDMWCSDAWDIPPTEGFNARSFGHPTGMCYAGRAGKYIYLLMPKVATTIGRLWAKEAFREESERKEARWLIPNVEKPLADRNQGAALYRNIPLGVRATALAFCFVRDPLDRFASGWRELLAYERGPPPRRGWGKRVLRQRPFYNTTAVFGGAGQKPTQRELDAALSLAVLDLACDADWNEHLTPQLTLIPAEFLASKASIIAPNEHIADLLPNVAKQLGLNQETARKFVASENKRSNARAGWPQPEDLVAAFDRFDATASSKTPTRHVWCWVHARDYAHLEAFYKPPAWCADAFAS